MKSSLSVLMVTALVVGGVYWYGVANAICRAPVFYHVGSVDSRFGLSVEEVRNLLSSAESLWEDKTGKNLFTYEDNKGIPVNFIFDERQQEANEEGVFRDKLEEKEHQSDTLKFEYKKLLDEYNALRARYDKESADYDKRLRQHNALVNSWNEKGGAPKDVYQTLQAEEAGLKKDAGELNTLAGAINDITGSLNQIGAKGNSVISDYNKSVSEYNKRFTEGHEFTQGDYERKGSINVYQFDTKEELVIVLAHEFGHALSLGHVENDDSVMYKRMNRQSKEKGLSREDIVEFDRVCGKDQPFLFSLLQSIRNTVTRHLS